MFCVRNEKLCRRTCEYATSAALGRGVTYSFFVHGGAGISGMGRCQHVGEARSGDDEGRQWKREGSESLFVERAAATESYSACKMFAVPLLRL